MNIQSLNLIVDINNDNRYSAWELWEAIKFVYRLPGNLLVEGMGHIPPLASLFNIDATPANGYGSLDGLLSVTLTLIFWVILIFGMLTLASPSPDDGDDERMTGFEALPNANSVSSRQSSVGTVTGDSTIVTLAKRPHHPVSRPVYAAPGKKPKRHPWHHFTASWFRQVKP